MKHTTIKYDSILGAQMTTTNIPYTFTPNNARAKVLNKTCHINKTLNKMHNIRDTIIKKRHTNNDRTK